VLAKLDKHALVVNGTLLVQPPQMQSLHKGFVWSTSLGKACVLQAAIGSTTIIPLFYLMQLSSIFNTGGASSITLSVGLSVVDNVHTPHNVCI
jgi:hypothetical protein